MFEYSKTHSDVCPVCNGSGRNPKKRKRECLRCDRSGTVRRCDNCDEIHPCSGIAWGFDVNECRNEKVAVA